MKTCKVVELGIVNSINKNGSGKDEAAQRLIELIEKGKMRNPHVCDYSSLSERYGSISDYFPYHEQRELERYQRFLPCFAYDYVLEAEEEMNKELTLTKVSSIHGD